MSYMSKKAILLAAGLTTFTTAATAFTSEEHCAVIYENFADAYGSNNGTAAAPNTAEAANSALLGGDVDGTAVELNDGSILMSIKTTTAPRIYRQYRYTQFSHAQDYKTLKHVIANMEKGGAALVCYETNERRYDAPILITTKQISFSSVRATFGKK